MGGCGGLAGGGGLLDSSGSGSLQKLRQLQQLLKARGVLRIKANCGDTRVRTYFASLEVGRNCRQDLSFGASTGCLGYGGLNLAQSSVKSWCLARV